MSMRLGLILTALMVVLTSAAAYAQPLADRVPADTLVYVGWRGTNAAGPAYENSNLKGFIEAANLREQADKIIARITADAGNKSPQEAANVKMVFTVLRTLSKYPTALYFGGLDDLGAGKPKPKLALLCEAGADAPVLVEPLAAAIKSNPNSDPNAPVTIRTVGKYVLLTIGSAPDVEKLLGEHPDAPAVVPLANDANFKDALAQVQADPFAILYVNGEKALELIDDAVARGQDTGAKRNWPILVDALGLSGADRFVATGGFDGQNWSTQAFFKMEPQRHGVLALLDAKPLTDDSLKLIPQSATWAGAIRFDPVRLLKDVKDAAGQVDPNMPAQLEFMLQQGTNALGFDVQKDLIEVLSDEWLYYGAPEATGQSIRGAVLLNKVKDEKAILRAMDSIEDLLNARLARGGGDKAFTTEQAGDMTIHSLKLALVSPSWTVYKGMLYISLAPQALQAAADFHAGKGKSILDNPDFVALRKQLGGTNMTSFSFADLPKTAPEVYELFNLVLTAAAADAGEKKLPFELPPLFKIKPFLAPTLAVYYTDDKGWHRKATEPFPGSGVFSGEQTLAEIAGVALQGPVGKARARAKQAASMSHLRTIGMACMAYSAENAGQLPPDLGALVAGGYVGKEGKALPIFVGPDVPVPAEIQKAPLQKQAEWVNQNSSYVYVGAGKKQVDLPADTVLAYERRDAKPGAPIGVLFADGHVEELKAEELKKRLPEAGAKP